MLRRRNRPGPIGIDIGAAGVKLIQFAPAGGQPSILAAAHQPLPPGTTDADERAQFTADAIALALRQQPFHGRSVVTALSIGEFDIKNIRLPRMPEEERATAIQFEADERFDLAGTPAQIRYLPAGEVRHGNELKQEFMVFAAGESLIEARLKLLHDLKLQPLAIDLAPCAAARSFVRFLRRADDVNAVNVFLDVGYRGTSIMITRGMELIFLKQIEVGGAHFNEAVSKALNITIPEAADLRLRVMRESSDRRNDDPPAAADPMHNTVADAVRPLVERLSRDVQLCLRYFAVTFRGQKPDCLTFVGGEAHEPALTRLIESNVDIPCIIGNALRGVGQHERVARPESRTYQPAWAVATGLALRGSQWVQSRISPIRAAGAVTIGA